MSKKIIYFLKRNFKILTVFLVISLTLYGGTFHLIKSQISDEKYINYFLPGTWQGKEYPSYLFSTPPPETSSPDFKFEFYSDNTMRFQMTGTVNNKREESQFYYGKWSALANGKIKIELDKANYGQAKCYCFGHFDDYDNKYLNITLKETDSPIGEWSLTLTKQTYSEPRLIYSLADIFNIKKYSYSSMDDL
jgi:hypothetical protein